MTGLSVFWAVEGAFFEVSLIKPADVSVLLRDARTHAAAARYAQVRLIRIADRPEINGGWQNIAPLHIQTGPQARYISLPPQSDIKHLPSLR